jgi:hypothetical protein
LAVSRREVAFDNRSSVPTHDQPVESSRVVYGSLVCVSLLK